MSQQKRFRSPENPTILKEIKSGGKICIKCKRRLPVADYSSKQKKGSPPYRSGACKDCEYKAALPKLKIVYGPPLKRVTYKPIMINGVRYQKKEIA